MIQVEKQFRGGGRAKWWQSSTHGVPFMLAMQPDRIVYARVRAVTKHIVTKHWGWPNEHKGSIKKYLGK